MDAVTYPQEQIISFIHDHFVPVRIHTEDHPDLCEKYRLLWTPTVVVLDAEGAEHYRDAGYLPPEDFLPHLNLALGRAALAEKDFATAGKFFQTVVDQYGSSEVVPEALYFLGVAKNRISGGTVNDRKTIWKRLVETHAKSDWAKKASVAFD